MILMSLLSKQSLIYPSKEGHLNARKVSQSKKRNPHQ